MKRLIPLDDWNDMRAHHAHEIAYPRFNGLECPRCHKEMQDKERGFHWESETKELYKVVACPECKFEGRRLV